MEANAPDFTIERLGECRIPSPVSGFRYVNEEEHVLYHTHLEDLLPSLGPGKQPPCMEVAGPRAKVYFDPSKL